MNRLISAFQTSDKLKHNCQGYFSGLSKTAAGAASCFPSNLSMLVYWMCCSVNVLHLPRIFSSAFCELPLSKPAMLRNKSYDQNKLQIISVTTG